MSNDDGVDSGVKVSKLTEDEGAGVGVLKRAQRTYY